MVCWLPPPSPAPGTLARLTSGASITLAPLMRISLAIEAEKSNMADRFHVAATWPAKQQRARWTWGNHRAATQQSAPPTVLPTAASIRHLEHHKPPRGPPTYRELGRVGGDLLLLVSHTLGAVLQSHGCRHAPPEQTQSSVDPKGDKRCPACPSVQGPTWDAEALDGGRRAGVVARDRPLRGLRAMYLQVTNTRGESLA